MLSSRALLKLLGALFKLPRHRISPRGTQYSKDISVFTYFSTKYCTCDLYFDFVLSLFFQEFPWIGEMFFSFALDFLKLCGVKYPHRVRFYTYIHVSIYVFNLRKLPVVCV